jgi:RecA-family ATPase
LNLSIDIACGKAFLEQFRVPRPFRVLFINEEVDEAQMQARLQKMMAAARERVFSGFENLQIVNRTGIRIDTAAGLKTAGQILRLGKPDVVIWDCLYRFHSKNENRAEDMQGVLAAFDSLTAKFGVSQCIIHHHGLPQKDSGRDNFQLMRGSSVLGAAGDSYLSLTRLKKTEPPNFQRLSSNLRNAADPEDIVLYRNPDTLWYEVSADPEAKEKLTVQNVVFSLKEMGGRAQRQELINKLTVDYDASERTAVNKITESVKLDRIKKQAKGQYCSLK